MRNNVLVVAAHPDDEILGCGATMAQHALNGDRVHIVIIAEGLTSRSDERNRSTYSKGLSELAQAAHEASRIVGAKSLALHNFPDNRLDSVDLLDVVKVVEKAVQRIKPDIVYTHHAGDLNIDHRIVHEAVVTSCRPLPGHSVNSLRFFEVPSSTNWQAKGNAPGFNPDVFVDVSKTLKRKLAALKAYGSEMRPWPHARSLKAIEYLAKFRGSTVGLDAAEAFVLGREIIHPK